MPNPIKNPFAHRPQAVNIDRGPYSMNMEDGENAEITMYGEVVETHPTHWWTDEPLDGDFIAQDDFLRDLDSLAKAKTVTIRLNSVGGDALVGMVIHNRLRELSGKGTHLICIVDGAAMSAASVIMCACDEVRINPASLVMIHRCWGYLWGGYNADDLRETAAMYDAYDRAAVTTYQRRTKLSEAELLRMMSETTWLTGSEAVEKGFADQLIEDAEPLDIAASADGRSLWCAAGPSTSRRGCLPRTTFQRSNPRPRPRQRQIQPRRRRPATKEEKSWQRILVSFGRRTRSCSLS